MLYFRLIACLLLPLFMGYCLIVLINRNKLNFFEGFALAWGIGIGLLGIEMFTLSLLGFSINLWAVSVLATIFVFLSLIYILIKKVPLLDLQSLKRLPSPFFEASYLEKILMLLIGLTIFYVFFDALVKPIVNFDDLWRQGSIAKIIFSTGKAITPQAAEVAGGHPYLNPLSQAWVYLGIGEWNDALGKIIFPLCFTSLLFIFYSSLRRKTNRFYALLMTYLLTSFPLIIYHAGTAYSDLMQTFYYCSGIIYLFEWMQNKEKSFICLSALFLGIGNFVKQEGIPLWSIAIVVLFAFILAENRKLLKEGGFFILISSIISAPWLFYPNSFLMQKLSSLLNLGFKTSTKISTLPSLPYGNPSLEGIFSNLGRRMFTYADWQILWFVFFLSLIFGWKFIWSSKLKYLALIIFFDLGVIIYAFMEPSAYQYLIDGTLVERLLMYFIPVVLYFTARVTYKITN